MENKRWDNSDNSCGNSELGIKLELDIEDCSVSLIKLIHRLVCLFRLAILLRPKKQTDQGYQHGVAKHNVA